MTPLKITNSTAMHSNESELDEISENLKEPTSKMFNKTKDGTNKLLNQFKENKSS